MSMGKKKKATQSFPFEYYCIAIGLRGGTDEFSTPRAIPMLPDWETYMRIEWDLKTAGLFDEDGLPCFEDIHTALESLREYLANAPDDRFDGFDDSMSNGGCGEQTLSDEGLSEDDF